MDNNNNNMVFVNKNEKKTYQILSFAVQPNQKVTQKMKRMENKLALPAS